MNKYVEGQVLRHVQANALVTVKEINPCDELNMYRVLSCGGAELSLANGYYWFTQKTVEQDFVPYVAPKFKAGDKIRRIADGLEVNVMDVDSFNFEEMYKLDNFEDWFAQDTIEDHFELAPEELTYKELVKQVKDLKAEYKAYKAHFNKVKTKLFEKEEALHNAQDELDKKVAKDCE